MTIQPIVDLRDPTAHYRCSKCYNFPKIRFLVNQESIYYSCACKENEFLNIEDLFNKKNKHMTFLDNDKLKEDNTEKKDGIIGFKCTKHKSTINNKYNKFKYFCIPCKENICKDCVQNHLKNNHDLIVLDYEKFELYRKIDEIRKKISLEKKKE